MNLFSWRSHQEPSTLRSPTARLTQYRLVLTTPNSHNTSVRQQTPERQRSTPCMLRNLSSRGSPAKDCLGPVAPPGIGERRTCLTCASAASAPRDDAEHRCTHHQQRLPCMPPAANAGSRRGSGAETTSTTLEAHRHGAFKLEKVLWARTRSSESTTAPPLEHTLRARTPEA